MAAAALAAAGDAATAEQRALAVKVQGHALTLNGEYAAALACLHAGLAALPADLPLRRVDLLRALSSTHEQMNDLAEALALATQAAALARAAGDPERLAEALLTTGVVRSRSGDHAGGLEHFAEALAVFEAAGEQTRLVRALCNMGIACKNLDRPADAVRHLERAAALAVDLGDTAMAATPLANLIEPLRQLGRLPESLEAAQRVLDLLGSSGGPDVVALARLQRGQTLAATGQTEAALHEMHQALDFVHKRGGRLLTTAHLALAQLYKQLGHFELALQHHEAYHAADRKLLDDSSARTLKALQVRFQLERAEHEAQVQRLEAKRLSIQSRTDALTGAANRRHLDEHLLEAFAAARRLGHPLAVAMVDIDDFKGINDGFGHPLGDAVLQQVAEHLRANCRAIDLVARFGGEEFCIVFAEADAAHAQRACEAARLAIEQHDWSALRPALRVSVSIGLADHPSLDSPQALLAEADAQLYAAKRAGKNRVCWRV